MQEDYSCYFCGRTTGLERHHIFAGVANRKIAEAEGIWCYLCPQCHRGTEGAQYDKEKNRLLKQDAQRRYEQTHSRREWMELIRKNYLG